MAHLVLLLLGLFPLVANANVIINFKHEPNGSHSFETFGNTTAVIENSDRDLFFMTDEALRTGVEALAGTRPDTVLLTNTFGQFSNVFESNGWTQTTTVTTAHTLQFRPAGTRQVEIDRRTFNNSLGVGVPRVVNMENDLRRVGRSAWFNVPSCSWLRQIIYNIHYNDRCPITINSMWGCDLTDEMSTRVANVVTQVIPARQTLQLLLTGSTVQYDIVVMFETSLHGHAIGYWSTAPPHQQLRAFPIDTVLRLGAMPLIAYTNNLITIEDTAQPQLTTNTY